jgi:hypothetical protein
MAVLAAMAALQVVALVLAHELVYIARFGSRYGEALVHAGHGESWSTAVTTSLSLGAVLVLAGALRLAHLGVRVRRHGGGIDGPRIESLDPGSLVRGWFRVGTAMALLTVLLLTLQENLERAAIGGRASDPGILLSAEYAGGLWIAVAVAFGVALVAALFDWRRRVLLARLRAGKTPLPRGADRPQPRPRTVTSRPTASTLGRGSALRAPPALAAI